MRVIVTNDDGIDAIGLAVLTDAVRSHGHDVVAVAPSTESSGSSAGLGVVRDEHRVRSAVRESGVFEGIEAYCLDAPPALGVRAACTGAFGPTPDLVVSGVNPGFNTGRLVVHSGTVGAAVTAASLDVCGAAFSTAARSVHGLDTTAHVAGWILRGLIGAGLPPVAVNVNVPDLPVTELTGVGFTDPGSVGCYDVQFDLHDRDLIVRQRQNPPPYEKGSDADLLTRGMVAVSVLVLPWRTEHCAGRVVSEIDRCWRSGMRTTRRVVNDRLRVRL